MTDHEQAFLDEAGDDPAERARRADFLAAINDLVESGEIVMHDDGTYSRH
jgi:hypothetical protein